MAACETKTLWGPHVITARVSHDRFRLSVLPDYSHLTVCSVHRLITLSHEDVSGAEIAPWYMLPCRCAILLLR